MTIVVECFFRQPCAMGVSVGRSYWARTVRGVVGGQADGQCVGGCGGIVSG